MRRLPIILLTVLAWVVGANAVTETYYLVAEADTAIADNKILSVEQFATLTGDDASLILLADYDAGGEYVTFNADTRVTIDLNGYTVTTGSYADSSAWVYFSGSSNYFTVKNGTILDSTRTYAPIRISASNGGTLEDLTITSTGSHGVYTSSTAADLTVTDCIFQVPASKKAFYSAATGTGLSITGCTFSGASGEGVRLQGTVSAAVSNCTFSDLVIGIVCAGATQSVSGCTFDGVSSLSIQVITGASDIDVSDCTFDEGGDTTIHFLTEASGGHTVSDCVFTHCGEYTIKVEDTDVTIDGCTWGEQDYHSMHGIMYGNDNGSQLETDLSGVVTDCDFAFSVVGDSLTMTNFHYFVIKADSLRAHGNIFRTVRSAANNSPTATGTCFFLKGCNDVMIYNNTMDIDGFAGLKYRVQGTTYTDSTNVAFSNTFGSTLDYAMYCWTKAAKDSLFQKSNGNIYNNQYLCQVGYNGAENVDMMNADSIWYNAQSFTTEGDWHYYLGGSTDAGALYRYDSRFEPTYVGAPNDSRKTRYGFDQVLLVGIGQPWPTPKFAWSCWDDTLGNAGTRLPLFELIPAGASASQLLSIELNHNLFMAEADSALVDSVWIHGTVLDKSEIYPANDAPR